jgi:hypothetical protein
MNEHFTRMLVAGVGPLPPENQGRVFAPGLRAWGIARELARAGHPTRLVCTRFGEGGATATRYDLAIGPGAAVLPEGHPLTPPNAGDNASDADNAGNGNNARVHGNAVGAGLAALLADEARDWGAQAAVGTSDVMNLALAQSGLEIPIWMDYLGDPMAERQLLALRHGSDGGVDDQWAMLAPVLARADKLSGCSTEQCAALLGELGAVGRLGRHTATYPLVHCVYPWVEPIAPLPAAKPLLRGSKVPANAFLAIQTGGFNTWLDVEMLFAALELAMAKAPRVHFAVAGGAIPGHYGRGYEWFEQQVKASPRRDRYHLLGWLAAGDVPRLLAEADLGLNLDLPCAEGILGTRSRLLDWLLAGLPIVSTPGCETAQEMAAAGYLTLAPMGDAKAAARAIVAAAAARPEFLREAARQGSRWLAKAHAPEACLRPLLAWAEAPKPAPDLQAWRLGEDEPPALWRQAAQAAQALAARRRSEQKTAWMEQKLARLEGSRWVRMALRLRGREDLEPPPEG